MKKVTWKRERQPRPGDLTPEEQESVRIAAKVLRIRLGNGQKLAKAMGLSPKALEHRLSPTRKVDANLALEVARLAGVTIDDVIQGRFPAPGACPACGCVCQ